MNAKYSAAKTVIKYAAPLDGDVYGTFLHNVIVPKIANQNHVAVFDNINLWFPDNRVPTFIQGLQGVLTIHQKGPYMYDVRDRNTNEFLFSFDIIITLDRPLTMNSDQYNTFIWGR